MAAARLLVARRDGGGGGEADVDLARDLAGALALGAALALEAVLVVLGGGSASSVSYTHLTLPTILLV